MQRILVFFGGSDASNETLKAVHALRELGRPDIAVDVVVGAAYPHVDSLTGPFAALPQATLHRRAGNMAELMTRADLALGAAGAATWERCCLRLPAIVVTLAANQESTARALAAHACAVYLGPHGTVSGTDIAASLGGLLANPSRIRSMARAAGSLVDGRGTERVVAGLDSLVLP